MRKRGDVLRQRNAVPVTAALRRIYAGLQTSPCRSADGLAGEIIFKQNAFLRQTAKIRGDGFVDRVPALLVGKIENDVFLFRFHAFLPLSRKARYGIVNVYNRHKCKRYGKYLGDDFVG